MDALVRAAAEAADELRRDSSPEGSVKTREFGRIAAEILHQRGLKDFNENFWRAVLAELELDIPCTADVFFWVCGVAQTATELS